MSYHYGQPCWEYSKEKKLCTHLITVPVEDIELAISPLICVSPCWRAQSSLVPRLCLSQIQLAPTVWVKAFSLKQREAGAWDGIWPLWLQVNSERCNGVKAATMCGSARWLPSNVIPPDNRHKCLSSGPPDSAGRGIFLQGSVGSMVCNHTAWFFSVIHVFSETSEELKGIRPMELKKWGIRDKPHPKPSLVPYLFWIPQCLGLLSFLLCNTRGIEYNL